MKYIKKFENFVNDENRGETAEYPAEAKDPSLSTKIKNFINHKLDHDYKSLFDVVGMKMPSDLNGEELDKIFDEVREKAIKYYMEHPEELEDWEVQMKPYKYAGSGDAIPKVQKVGGALSEGPGGS